MVELNHRRIRRVVTGREAQGKSVIVQDEASPFVLEASKGGPVVTDLWKTFSTLADNRRDAEPGSSVVLAPPEHGTVFCIVQFPPDADYMADWNEQAAFQKMGHQLESGACARTYLQPTLKLLRPLPASALVPVAIALLGLTDAMILSVVVFGALWPTLLSTIHGFSSVEPRLHEVSRILGLFLSGFIRRRRRPRKVTGKLPTSGGSDSRWGSRQQFHAVLAWVIKILTLLPAFFDPILLTPDKKTEWKETRVNESIRKGQAPGRRRFDAVAAIALLAACGTHAAVNAESTYPEKPVRMVVGFAPGTPPEIMARLIAHQFTKTMGQTFFVDARAGAGSTIATASVARAKPDGLTLMLGVASGLATGPHVIPNTGYDPRRDFEAIGFVQRGPYYISVRSELPIHDLKSMLAYNQSASSPLVYGSLGVGSVHQLLWELLTNKSGADLTHLPFGGTPQMVNEGIAGRVDLMLEAASSLTLPYVQSGKFRYIAMTGRERSAKFPDVATVAEQGFDEMQSESWWVLLAPKGTPASIVQKLNAELAQAMRAPEVQLLLESIGGTSAGVGTPEEAQDLIRTEYERWGAAIARNSINTGIGNSGTLLVDK